MWRIMQGVRYVGSAMMLDRVYRRVKDATATDPSLDQALERYSKAHEEMLKMEQVIAMKHRKLQDIINRVKKED